MYIQYQNKICLPVSALFDSGIIRSEGTYKTLYNRGHLKVIRSGFDKTKTLIDAKEMRADIKAKVIALFGAMPDKSSVHLANYIEWDTVSEGFFRTYRYGDDKPLPEDTILEYTTTASILNAFKTLLNDVFANSKVTKAKLWSSFSKASSNLPETYPNRLPSNARSLQRVYKKYINEGPRSIIHKNFGNEHTLKLTSEAKEWCLARWSNQVNRCANLAQLHAEFNEIAEANGWKPILGEKTFYNYIYDESTQYKWYGHRYGSKAAKQKYDYRHTTIMALQRDSLWYGDGTKLNLYYQDVDSNGRIVKRTANVYEVMDAFSEVFLGFHVSKESESFNTQYPAYKMAAQFAGRRPYEIRFDNQGGHKKLIAAKFYEKLSRLSIATQPYNGSSKSIESAFGRFQQQFLSRMWFSTGQNVTAKKQESKPNMELINANVKELPTFDELIELYKNIRDEWNNATHHLSGKSRIETYFESENEKAPTIDIWDMVNIFWVWHTKSGKIKPLTYTPGGISFRLNKTKFEYVVCDEKGMPDNKFIQENTNKKLFVKYDPEMMDEVYLYEKDHAGERFLAIAKTKTVIHRAIQDQSDKDTAFLHATDAANKASRIQRHEFTEDLLEKLGMAAFQQGLRSPKIAGLNNKTNKSVVKPRKEPVWIQDDDKRISNLTHDIYDEY